MRYLTVYWLMIRNSLIREMNFKANFVLWIVVECLWFTGQILFLEVLYGHVDEIGGWTKWQCVLLVGTHQAITQVFQAFFYVNLADITELVRTGRLDLLLLQPIDSQFVVSTRRFGLDSLVSAFVSVCVVVFCCWKLGLSPAPGTVLLYCALLVVGLGVHYAVLFALATLSIWIVRAQGLIYGYFNLFNIARYPDSIFTGIFKILFSSVLPVLLVANVPARTLARTFENPWPGIVQLVGATAFVLVATRAFWFYALRRYSSASS
jgi:ABC-2 type transport system permease protein